MCKSVEAFASLRIPDLAVCSVSLHIPCQRRESYAEKSAEPVAANVASDESAADQQAPL
jgi:hypothetical protein